MVYVQWYTCSLYVRRGSIIAGEFERWKLTVKAADSIAKCDAYTPISSCSSQLFVTLPMTSATELLSEKYDGQIAFPWFCPDEH